MFTGHATPTLSSRLPRRVVGAKPRDLLFLLVEKQKLDEIRLGAADRAQSPQENLNSLCAVSPRIFARSASGAKSNIRSNNFTSRSNSAMFAPNPPHTIRSAPNASYTRLTIGFASA